MDRLQEIFSQILSMDMTGSIAILLVLGIRLLLQKAPKRYSYFLWGIVWFRHEWGNGAILSNRADVWRSAGTCRAGV